MAFDAHANFATSLVATAPSPATSGTSLVVTGGEGSRFPATPFNATICPATADATPANAEVVRVTNISTDTFTITRATEGSSARTVVVGDRIYAGVTAKTLTDIEVSPTFTGTPAAPTAAANTSTTQVATTAYADNAAAYGASVPPTGVTYQNVSRYMSTQLATIGPLTSGQMRLQAIWLPAGFTVTSVSWVTGTTALNTSGSGPHFWFALYNNAAPPHLLRQSTDVTNATWAASTLKTVNLSSSFQTTYTGLHYLGVMVVSGSTGTQPTLAGFTTGVTTLVNLAPIIGGSSTGSLAATAPTDALAITATTGQAWCGVA